jgi:VWFA-related protein
MPRAESRGPNYYVTVTSTSARDDGEIKEATDLVEVNMRNAAFAFIVIGLGSSLFAQSPEPEKKNAAITLTSEALGDGDDGVVTRLTIDFQQVEPPEGVPIEMQGSIISDGAVVRNFRYLVRPRDRAYSFIQTLPAGKILLQVRLLVPIENEMPIIIGKLEETIEIVATGEEYIASESDGAEAIFAEGVVPETAGAVRILPPKRDLAPNLYIVEAQVKPPVRKVEFWADGKKVFTRNSPPYRAELDLGVRPRRMEVRVVGYDRKGRFIDADAWIVSERDNPVEAKITKNETGDGLTHLKVSVQNNERVPIAKVVLESAGTPIAEWTRAPYAIALPSARLAGVDFVTVIVLDAKGNELASDLLFLDGGRYIEEIQVNLIELPVTVYDSRGNVLTDLTAADFEVYEQGVKQEVASFGFASNLPLSLGVLVDHSGSMQPRIETARTAALEFFQRILRDGDKAFFGGFSWEAQRVSPFLTDLVSLRSQVSQMPAADGGTALYDSIVTGLYRFRSIPGRKALIVVSDGEDTVSRLPYADMLRYVRTARVPIYFIGIDMPAFGTSKMKALANETGAVAFLLRKVEELAAAYDQLEKDLRSQYLVAYYSEAMKDDDGYRNVEVRVKREGAVVRTIRGYIP